MTSAAEPAAPRRTLFWCAALAVALGYVAFAAFHVACGAMNVDEGFYAAAARAVWQGEVPYRDFGFTQPPLVPYADAPLLRAIGFGLFQQRAVNGLWGALAILLGAIVVARRAGGGWAVLFAAVFALSPPWLYFTNLGKTYGFTALVATAAAAVFLEAKPGAKKAVALSFLGVIGVGCRLPAAPFFGVLWLAALGDGSRPTVRGIAIALGSLLLFTAALLLPFYLLAPEQSLFWTVDFHRISVPKKDWSVAWDVAAALAPAVWLLLLAAAGFALVARRRWPFRETALAVASLLALAANLLPRGVYEEYGVPFLPPLALAALLLLVPATGGWPRGRRALCASALLALPFLLTPALDWRHLSESQRTFPSYWLTPNVRPYNFALRDHLRQAKEALRRVLPPGEPFVGSCILLAVETDHPIPRRFRMGAFTMTNDYSPARADRLHLMTYTEFEENLRDIDLPALGLHADPLFNFAWSVPSFDPPNPALYREWTGLLGRYFTPVYQDADFVVLARPFNLPLFR
jgi:4-amino-4-deoxy-L-arabinose transferase-like glycosyltransferase